MSFPIHLENHPYKSAIKKLSEGRYYFDLAAIADEDTLKRLPSAIKVILENAVRNCNGESVTTKDVDSIKEWGLVDSAEVSFCPARVLLQDFTGVPAVVDLAAMRSIVKELGGNPLDINPQVPTELVVDHSIIVESARTPDALRINEELEFERNGERFAFLKWGAQAFENMRVIPPGNGICHQVNLEFLARAVFDNKKQSLVYPDTVVGTDSHTTMISGLGILGWGVGGIEAEAVMLGQPYSLMLPEIVGFKLIGCLSPLCTATDLVLHITSVLRSAGVVGKIVEFFGEGYGTLSVADRATIANMAPEYGATTGYFPPDDRVIEYLQMTGRDEEHIAVVRQYIAVSGISDNAHAEYSTVITLDMSTVEACVAGPKRPQDLVMVRSLKSEFLEGLTKPVDFSSFGIATGEVNKKVELIVDGASYMVGHGLTVIAAITSCTNTSNPAVMIGAGLIAKKAIEYGLEVPKYVKTSLSPGSATVMDYLEKSNLVKVLADLGFNLAGYGCMTCIGNSGDLIDPHVDQCIKDNDLVASAVLSGNRNFEGRVHPITRANYLASPMLVVAYALAGRVDIDFEVEPISKSDNGKEVFLRDIWPTKMEIEKLLHLINKDMFLTAYGAVGGNDLWKALPTSNEKLYGWKESTYVAKPPFFDGMSLELDEPFIPIKNARVLGLFGDSITTDHISPAGKITAASPAGVWLLERGVTQRMFNSYGTRRGHDQVMVRGTFANIRLVNKIVGKVGPFTRNMTKPEAKDDYFYNVAMEYKEVGLQSIIFGGKFYGSGSSRDWAAKGTAMQGVRAVIVESFERIHRSNLIGMGVLPLQFNEGDSVESLNITGQESWELHVSDDKDPLTVGGQIRITSDKGHDFNVLSRIDTSMELKYYRAGGILHYMVKKLSNKN